MKILIVCQFYYPENFTISKIAEELVNKGHQVDVLTGKPNYGFGKILDEYKDINFEVINGVNVNRVNIRARKKDRFSIIENYLSYWWNAKRWVRRTKNVYDMVFSMSLSPVTILAPANLYKKRFKVPHICHCVDLWPESVAITHAVGRRNPIFKFLYYWSKSLYKKCDEIIIGSPSFKEYFDNVLKIKNMPITYIPQTSLIQDLSNVKKVQFDDEINVTYCGNIGSIQNIEKLPQIISLIKDKRIKMHVIGMGNNQDLFLENIKKYHVEDRIEYLGPMKFLDAAKYLLGSDAIYVSLAPSGYVGKTIPNKLVMSLAFGLPIIASLKGDGETIAKEAGGCLVDDDNPTNVAKLFDEFALLDKSKRLEMGESNRKYYLDTFSLDIISNKIEQELLKFRKK